MKGISVFVLVESHGQPYDGALYEVKLEGKESEEAAGKAGVESPLPVLDPVFEFFDKSLALPKHCLFGGARLDSSKLYLTANGNPWPHNKRLTTPKCFVFDTVNSNSISALNFQHCISPPKAAKSVSALMSAYGMLYYLACPSCAPEIPKPSFECYDPATNSWRRLPPCPYRTMHGPCMEVLGFAVCYGYILISFYNHNESAAMAFHIDTQKWHPVQVCQSKDAYPFRGRAVVVDGMIYALSWRQGQVIAFSFSRDSDGNCFLGAAISLQLRNTSHPPSPLRGMRTQSLVHLGTQDFCLIQTGRNEYSIEHQYMRVTTFQILHKGGARVVRTLHSSVYQVDIKGGYFFVDFAFTPDCKDIEPEEKDCPIVPVKTESLSTLEDNKSKEDCR
ncbi:uncharacterized protein LOC112201880 [Rosa chinensis]|uniref:uncharacterized protein LOC112201880 n=1 Tax=Rosa chinensis TaxID=74649 RepID=UPI000D092E8A|nr:uncharacterized protein LOC112201880 [Rosa chinensis]